MSDGRIYLRDVLDPVDGKKVGESGPWQACPRCGLERIPSANGIRAHDEFCNGAFQPFMTLLANRGLRPFERVPHDFGPKVLGELLPLRWRVAPDQWYRLEAEVRLRYGTKHEEAARELPAGLYGWPIESDPSLAAGEIVLESDDMAS